MVAKIYKKMKSRTPLSITSILMLAFGLSSLPSHAVEDDIRYFIERGGDKEYIQDPRTVDFRGVDRVCWEQSVQHRSVEGAITVEHYFSHCLTNPQIPRHTGESTPLRQNIPASFDLRDLAPGLPAQTAPTNEGSTDAPAGGMISPPSQDTSGWGAVASHAAREGWSRELNRVQRANTEGIKASLTPVGSGLGGSGIPRGVTPSGDFGDLRFSNRMEERQQQIVQERRPQAANLAASVWQQEARGFDPKRATHPKDILNESVTQLVEALSGADRSRHLDAVEEALSEIQSFLNSKDGVTQNSGYYIEKQLIDRGILNDQGLIHNLPGVDYTGLRLTTSLRSSEGFEVRTAVNTVIVAQSMVQDQCPGLGAIDTEGCSFFNSHTESLKVGLLLADRLGASGHSAAFKHTLSELRPYLDALKGFTRGALRGGVLVGAGVVAAAILPPAVTVTLAAGAVGYVIYEGVKAITESQSGVQGLIREKWQSFIHSDEETQGEIIGELTADLTGLIFGCPLAAETQVALKKGVELVVHRFAAQEMVLAADSAGSLTAAAATNLNALADQAPDLASTLLRSEGIEGVQRMLDSAASIQKFNPINHGPLHAITEGVGTVADAFRSSSYLEIVTKEPVKLYRVYATDGKELSAYWSHVKPTGPYQAVLDSALDPSWGNSAKKWVEITVPSGEKFYEGVVGEVALRRFNNPTPVGQILGGGHQVYVNKIVPRTWITNGGGF